MNKCREIRPLFPDALYGKLSPQEAAKFEEHRKTCRKCAAKYAMFAETLQLMSRRKRTDPGAEFWDGYWSRLNERMNREQARPLATTSAFPGWILRAAAVLLLVGAGVLIGKFYFSVPVVRQTSIPQTLTSAQSNELRASNFLDKSETILLALVNFDPDREAAETLNLKRQKEASQRLVREASYLEGQLTQPENRKLQKLVSDLQVILLQIANLEEKQDVPEIDLVKGGVNRKGILLKINLEQMRMASQNAEASRARPQSGKSGL